MAGSLSDRSLCLSASHLSRKTIQAASACQRNSLSSLSSCSISAVRNSCKCSTPHQMKLLTTASSSRRENVTNALLMIQPTLMAYSLDQPPAPVLLDVSSLHPERILLLDTFFHVVVFHGSTIAKWRDDQIQERPEFQHFGALVKLPATKPTAFSPNVSPPPMYIHLPTAEGKSQSRLTAKLSLQRHTHSGGGEKEMDGQPRILTDDVSLQTFLDHSRVKAVETASQPQ